MSLVNQMLQDLERRRALDENRPGLSGYVRPLPEARRSWRPWLGAGLALLVGSTGVAVWWALLRPVVPDAGRPAPAVQAAAIAQPPLQAPAAPPDPAVPQLGALLPPDPVPAAPARQAAIQPAAEPVRPAPEARPPVAADPAPRVAPPARASGAGLKLSDDLSVPRTERQAAAATAPMPAPTAAGPVVVEKQMRAATARERADLHYRRALEAVGQGRTADAVAGLRAALGEDAGHGAARLLLFRVHAELRQPAEADAVLVEGQQKQPKDPQWALVLARLQLERGDPNGAWHTLEAQLAHTPGSAVVAGLSGAVLQRLGRARESVEHYRTAVRLAPEEGRWWAGLGISLEAEGSGAEAREAFQRAAATGNLPPELAQFVERRLR